VHVCEEIAVHVRAMHTTVWGTAEAACRGWRRDGNLLTHEWNVGA
jgi:hypothetical protein